MDKQLHYVEMPKVFSHAVDGDELGADGWNQIQKNNLAGLAQNLFSTQVHNKIELVVGDELPAFRSEWGSGIGFELVVLHVCLANDDKPDEKPV